jgi:hypothetical protein
VGVHRLAYAAVGDTTVLYCLATCVTQCMP